MQAPTPASADIYGLIRPFMSQGRFMLTALVAATVSARIAEVLAHYATEVFGLMGNGNAHLVDAVARSEMAYTAVRHEAATVASADAYFRVSRKLAVATTTYGAGYTNTMTALADARMNQSPLVLVVGDAPTTGHRPWDVDQAQMAAAVGVPTFTVDQSHAGATTLAALRHAVEQRTPVVLAIPYDLPAATAEAESLELPERIEPPTITPDTHAITKAATALREAKRPVILAGRGARHAIPELTRIADRLRAVTTTSAPARGSFGGRTLDVGVCGGFASERAQGLLAQADVVLAVGASLNQFTMGFGNLFPAGTRIIQVNETATANHPQVSEVIQADSKLAAAALEATLDTVKPHRWQEFSDDEIAGAHFDREPGEALAADGRLDPRSLMAQLERALPENRLVVTDGGHFIGWPNTYLSLPSPDSIVMVGTAYQSIGLGFASAPGAAVAQPDRTLVVITGDGGGLMALADLDSTVRATHRAIVVVMNDSAYNAEVTQYGTIGLNQDAMLIDEVNFAAFAEGVGAEGRIIRTLNDLAELGAWLAEHETGTLLLDCRISKSVVAPYQHEIMAKLRASLGISEAALE